MRIVRGAGDPSPGEGSLCSICFMHFASEGHTWAVQSSFPMGWKEVVEVHQPACEPSSSWEVVITEQKHPQEE